MHTVAGYGRLSGSISPEPNSRAIRTELTRARFTLYQGFFEKQWCKTVADSVVFGAGSCCLVSLLIFLYTMRNRNTFVIVYFAREILCCLRPLRRFDCLPSVR